MTTAQQPPEKESKEAYEDFKRRLNPHNCKSFSNSSFYQEIKSIYEKMGEKERFFLSCIAMLTENEAVQRRLLTNLWVGEGRLETCGKKAPEELVDDILDKFRENGLIEPAEKLGKGIVKNYRMHPLVRSAVIQLSEKKFFHFDKGILTSNISGSNRACIVKYQAASENQTSEISLKNMEKIVTIFNVSEPFPDLNLQQLTKKSQSILGGDQWLSKIRNVKVLYLGRWLKSPTYHIEVESGAFLSGLKSMKELRLLSLKGISNINELPRSVGRLQKLIIIDVKECHNLEALPDDVSHLNNLIYLDVSNCHILDRMPAKGIPSLSNLQVFKGFVITAETTNNSSGLDDLKKLTQLRKLSIIANSNHFPMAKDLEVLQGLGTKLQNLAIAWESKQGSHGGTKGRPTTEESKATEHSAHLLPENLVKLCLQGFPKPKMPSWLRGVVPSKKSERIQKKLYIKGGMLRTLGNEPLGWVNTLCLKFLSDLKTDWTELQEMFPEMVYMEKVKCPRVTFCPCDEDGVWVKPPPTN